VDEQMPEPPTLRGREGLVGLEGAHAEQEQVVEVDERAPAFVLLVPLIERREHREGDGRLATAPGRFGLVVGGTDAPRLGPLDLSSHVGGLYARPAMPAQPW